MLYYNCHNQDLVIQNIYILPCTQIYYLSIEGCWHNRDCPARRKMKMYNFFFKVSALSVYLFHTMITPHTNRKMRQATSHCLKYIFIPSLERGGGGGNENIFSPKKTRVKINFLFLSPKNRWSENKVYYFLPTENGEN